MEEIVGGTATVMEHLGRHFTIPVEYGDQVLHTHQTFENLETTIGIFEDEAPIVRSLQFTLPNAKAALDY